MSLLVITQKIDINDDVLGFFHGWVEEFAKHCEKVIVICLQKGKYNLPNNVKVLSLGKEEYSHHSHVIRRLVSLFRFYKYIWKERKNYNAVFVHMNPEYIVLGGLLWKLWKKKIVLWYAHKAVNCKLRFAEKLTDKIFTASKESFGLKNDKLKILGHGIDTDKYKCELSFGEKKFDIVYVGRISEIKNQKFLIKAVDIMVNKLGKNDIKVGLIGGFLPSKGEDYCNDLKKMIEQRGLVNNIIFVGSVPNKDIVRYYCGSSISINLCPTGGMDKAALESMACGIPVIVLNKTFENVLNDPRFILKNEDKDELAEKILKLLRLDNTEMQELGKILRKKMVENYSLAMLIKKITEEI